MKRKMKQLIILISLCLITLILYRLFLTYYPSIRLLLDPDKEREKLMLAVRSHGVRTAILLILLTCLMCIVPGIPTSVVGVFAGIGYGPLVGSLVNIAGNAAGNFLSISIYKRVKFSKESNTSSQLTAFLSKAKYPRISIMFSYMIPLIPSSLVNFAVRLLDYNLKQIYWAILIGIMPGSILYAFGGDIFFKGNHQTVLSLLIGAMIVLLLVYGVYKRKKTAVGNR